MTQEWFRLLDDLRDLKRCHVSAPISADGSSEVEAWEFTMCRPWHRNVDLRANVTPGQLRDFTIGGFGVPYASEAAVGGLRAIAEGSCQFVRVTVGSISLYILNVLVLVDCFDYQRSEFTQWTEADGRPDKVGEVRMVTELRINAGNIPVGVEALRIEKWTVPIVVSGNVKRACELANLTGVRFERVD